MGGPGMALSAGVSTMRAEELPDQLHQLAVKHADDRRAFVRHGDAEATPGLEPSCLSRQGGPALQRRDGLAAGRKTVSPRRAS